MTTVRTLLALGFAATVMTAHAQEAGWKVPRTPWGDPDFQGAWVRRGVGIGEANPPRSPLGSFSGETGSVYPDIFASGVGSSLDLKELAGRRTGVVDPQDRVLPWRPEAEKARREYLSRMIPPASLKYVEAYARCVPPGALEGDDRHPHFIVQRPGAVVLAYEYNHVTRVIHTDGRPPVDKKIRLFMGDSVGHWEGDTLVVYTTNYTDKTGFSRAIPSHSDELRITERFTRVSPGLIDYQLTLEDPKLFSKAIQIAGYYAAAVDGTEPLEFACAEGSQTMDNIFGIPFAPTR